MVKRGFSLIELLVVIALIGILTAIATASYTTMQKKSRDTRRISDMKAIQQGMEQYYGDLYTYPGTSCLPGTTYLPNGLPSDPQPSKSYSSSCSTTTYCFCAEMEVETGNRTSNCAGQVTGSYFYCVTQLQ